MKYRLIKLVFALLVPAACCRAAVPTAPDPNSLGFIDHLVDSNNLETAVNSANQWIGTRFGRLVTAAPLPDDVNMFNHIVAHLNDRTKTYAYLGRMGNYKLYGMDMDVHLPNARQPSQHMAMFGMNRRTGDFLPLGFANYETRGAGHNRALFWQHARARTYGTSGWLTMSRLPGFPPDFDL